MVRLDLAGRTGFFSIAEPDVSREQAAGVLEGMGLSDKRASGEYVDAASGEVPTVDVGVFDFSQYWGDSAGDGFYAKTVAPFKDSFPGEPLVFFGYVEQGGGSTKTSSAPDAPSSSSKDDSTKKYNEQHGYGPDDYGYRYAWSGKTERRNYRLPNFDKAYNEAACQLYELVFEADKWSSDLMLFDKVNKVPRLDPYACWPDDLHLTVSVYDKQYEDPAGIYDHRFIMTKYDNCEKANQCEVVFGLTREGGWDDEDFKLLGAYADKDGYAVDVVLYVDQAAFEKTKVGDDFVVTDKDLLVDLDDPSNPPE